MNEPVSKESDKESLIEFPARLAVKAMGLNAKGFDDLVTSTVVAQLPEGIDHSVTRQESSGGKYVSVSVHFTASSHDELKGVYAALRNESRLLYLL